jgi:hypothetical protein
LRSGAVTVLIRQCRTDFREPPIADLDDGYPVSVGGWANIGGTVAVDSVAEVEPVST